MAQGKLVPKFTLSVHNPGSEFKNNVTSIKDDKNIFSFRLKLFFRIMPSFTDLTTND